MVFLVCVSFVSDGFAIPGDMDNDGFPDTIDHCPGKPETINGYKDRDGCPDDGQSVVEKQRLSTQQNEFSNSENQTDSLIPNQIQNDTENEIAESLPDSSEEILIPEPITETSEIKQEKLPSSDLNSLDFSLEEVAFETLIDFDNVISHVGEDIAFVDLIIYSLGMVVYGVFIWNFYRFLSRREMIPLRLNKYETDGKKITSLAVYIIKYVIVFPLVVLVWFVVYSTFLFFMAPDLSVDLVFLVVISLVVAVRISAYYKEDLAKDFAKLIPFALLGIFLTSTVFFTVDQIKDRLVDFLPFVSKILGFVIYAIIVEAILRILFLIKRKILPVAEEKLEEHIEKQIDEKIKVHVEKIDKKQKDLENKVDKETDEIEKKIAKESDKMEKKIEQETDDVEKKLKDTTENLKKDSSEKN